MLRERHRRLACRGRSERLQQLAGRALRRDSSVAVESFLLETPLVVDLVFGKGVVAGDEVAEHRVLLLA